MKARIVECRRMGFIERLKVPTLASFVTVWELENGREVPITSFIEGGWWTVDYLKDKLISEKQRKEELLKNDRVS